MKRSILKVLLTALTLVGLIFGFGILAGAQEEPTYVAQVGNTKYESIDEAVANWTNNTELTLLADVTLSDVVQIKSTEKHTLNLGTYTLTAASGKHALEVTAGNLTGSTYALVIHADATNPGSIVATGKSCIYYRKTGTAQDRPIIQINGGVFSGSYAINVYSSNAGTNAPHVDISGGIFNAPVVVTKGKLTISGGTFHKSINATGDQTSYRLFSGGRFKSFQFLTADAASKFAVGSGISKYDTGMYVDAEGYLVVGGSVITAPDTAYQASTTYDAWSSYLKYSSAAANGLYWSDINTAMTKNPGGNITVYVNELDMTGSSFKGKLILPKDGELSVSFAEGTAPAWSVIAQADGQIAVYTETVSDGVVTRSYSTITVSKNVEDGGAIQATASNEAGKAALIATPGANYYFVSWTDGDEVIGTETTCLLDLSQYSAIQANFALKTPEQTPTGSFEKPNKIIDLVPEAQYTVTCNGSSTDLTADAAGELTVQDTWYGMDISIVKKPTDITYCDSDAQIMTLPICYIITLRYGEGIADEVIRLFEPSLAYPIPKTIQGMIFMGWYDDDAFTVPHDFDIAITASMTLYARFADYDGEIKALKDALDTAINDLSTALEDKADAATVSASIEALQIAIANLEAAYGAADEALKEELLAAINAAKQEAIDAAMGYIPHIGENGSWWVGETDTGVNANGNAGADGADGTDGANGITPLIRINSTTYEWEVSYDNGLTWNSLGAKASATENEPESEASASEDEEDAGKSVDALTVSSIVAGTALTSNNIVLGAWSFLKKRKKLL